VIRPGGQVWEPLAAPLAAVVLTGGNNSYVPVMLMQVRQQVDSFKIKQHKWKNFSCGSGMIMPDPNFFFQSRIQKKEENKII
jgi:hypothetical protein